MERSQGGEWWELSCSLGSGQKAIRAWWVRNSKSGNFGLGFEDEMVVVEEDSARHTLG